MPFCTLCENQKPLCENQKTLYENQKTLCHLFLNPRALISPFRKHPYHCKSLIFLCHLVTSSLHNVTSSRSIRHPISGISLQRVALRGRELLLLRCLVILHLRPRRPHRFHILRVERTPEDASSLPKAATTWSYDISLSYCIYILYYWILFLVFMLYILGLDVFHDHISHCTFSE